MDSALQAANKIITVLSNNQILPADWKWVLPIYIVQQPRPVVANARNLAEGILEGIEKYQVDLPSWTYASFEGSRDYLMEEDWNGMD